MSTMHSDMRSTSFVFHRDNAQGFENTRSSQIHSNFRRRLQDRFDKEEQTSSTGKNCNSVENSWHNLSFDSKRVLRNSAEKITKTFSSVKVTFDTISQKFRSSTRRCHRLEEQYTPSHGLNMQTPQTRSRCLLGRTPTKLYSPFGIESPKDVWGKENDITSANAVPKRINKSQRFFRIFKEKRFYGLR